MGLNQGKSSVIIGSNLFFFRERISFMKLSDETKKRWAAGLPLMLMVIWLSQLVDTNSYFSVYALCGICAALCLLDNRNRGHRLTKLPLVLGLLIAALLSFAVTLANYEIFQRVRNINEVSPGTNAILNLLETVLTFAGGMVVFYELFLWLACRFPVCNAAQGTLSSGKHPGRVFTAAFGAYSLIYLVYLFFVVYPGNVTSDSVWQIVQMAKGEYTNHHPYWHTRMVEVFMDLGYALFRDANAAAATFNAAQSLAMAACFAYAVVTLYQYHVPKSWVLLAALVFVLLPVHITYSCTVWKDVPFGGAVLALVVAMFRIIRNVGRSKGLNYALLLVSGIAVSVLRSNGWYAMLAAFVVLALFFRKRCAQLLLPWLGCLILGWYLMGPALSAMGVGNINFIEGLSVPLQQVARVITEGGTLTEEETVLIDTILDIEEVPEIYTEHCVDPIKDAIRAKNYPYLQEHKGEFLKLWLGIGARYPWEYVEAWVEETKGYWNGGYEYYIYAQYVSDNDYGMYMVRQDNLIHDLVKAYFTLTRETVFFEPLQSIGLHVWILSLLCFFNLIHNRKEFLLTVPVLAVVFTLWLTTPVFSEFRYAYCLFTALPFILPVSLFKKENED